LGLVVLPDHNAAREFDFDESVRHQGTRRERLSMMKFIGRLFLCAMMVLALARASLAGAERHSNLDRVQVDVILKTQTGTWTTRKAYIYGYIDGRTVVCEEFKDKVEALCLVLLYEGEAVLVPTRLLEEKV
jgi:hypothetical protein